MDDDVHPRTETRRHSPADLPAEEFRRIGHALVDRISNFFSELPEKRVAPVESAAEIRGVLNPESEGPRVLPEEGGDAGALVDRAADLLFRYSVFNGHPRFWGYITSSPAPIGALADLLAAAVNANVGSSKLSPIATEIEAETVRWIAGLIGLPPSVGGLLTSGGNVANFTCLIAARKAKAGWDVRKSGLGMGGPDPLIVYASREAHTWVEKGADVFGFGTDAVRWIDVDPERRMDIDALVRAIDKDRANGARPFFLVGTAGTVGTGAVDPLGELARVAREQEWRRSGRYRNRGRGVPVQCRHRWSLPASRVHREFQDDVRGRLGRSRHSVGSGETGRRRAPAARVVSRGPRRVRIVVTSAPVSVSSLWEGTSAVRHERLE